MSTARSRGASSPPPGRPAGGRPRPGTPAAGAPSGPATHEEPAAELLARLAADPARGLGHAEAAARLARDGPNVLPPTGRRGPLLRFLLQFHHPLVYVLLGAAAATLALGEVVDAGVIFGVVLINAATGFVQEARAEQALESLVAMVETLATVVRDEERLRVPSADLVVGDLAVLEAGDRVPADLRLLSARDLRIDESALTGESVAATKEPGELPAATVLGDRANLAYSGSLVTYGVGTGVVVATGAGTEIGHIHRLMGEARGVDTPLTRKIAWFSRILTVAILALAAVTFAIGVARGEPTADMLTAAVALAVGAIPEALPAVVTITLAIGVARMARRNAIIRKLPAVETLGSTTVICTDKTGTLTENQMTVALVVAGGEPFEVTGAGYGPAGEVRGPGGPVDLDRRPALRECLTAGLLCNDALVVEGEARWEVVGDPTEGALVVAAGKAGLDRAALSRSLPRVDVLPFESARAYMATLHRPGPGSGGPDLVYVKGAVERVLDLCDAELGPDGRPRPLDRSRVLATVEALAGRALRVLAFARGTRPPEAGELAAGRLAEGGLALAGLAAMRDPPRPEAVAAVAACRAAGIAVKMITGDHAATARAIAVEMGVGGPEPVVMSGADLAACPAPELPEAAGRTAVFARVSPEQKLRLVEALQQRGHVVAMTGDGVNDGPALKQADIGVAMGRAGTEVAKEAAHMVLTDDNFASIEAAVEEGRGVFDNLTKFIAWALPTSLGEGLVILAAIVAGTTLPILPVQVLWVNMITAVALGLAFSFEPGEPDLMRRPPRDPGQPLLTRELAMRILLVSGIMVAGAFGLFRWEEARGAPVAEARTVAVNVFVLVEITYLFNCLSLERSMLAVGLSRNRWVWFGVGATLALQAGFTYLPPMNDLFRTAPIDGAAWIRVVSVAVAGYLVVELEKWIRRRLRAGRASVG